MNMTLNRYIALSAVVSLLCLAAAAFSLSRVERTALLPAGGAQELSFYVDDASARGMTVRVNGWAIVRGRDSEKSLSRVLLHGDSGSFLLPLKMGWRGDVREHFAADGKKYERSGFYAETFTFRLPRGTYRILLRHVTPKGAWDVDTGKTIRI